MCNYQVFKTFDISKLVSRQGMMQVDFYYISEMSAL